ncbi:MAG TPA: hypothetical protein VKT77_12565 [Chthonomonadaceae bacterium]|nr:hypothetical protein [Chthonomonadaceae bacterium]
MARRRPIPLTLAGTQARSTVSSAARVPAHGVAGTEALHGEQAGTVALPGEETGAEITPIASLFVDSAG